MNIHESAEDYLERILMLRLKNGLVRSIDIVRDMDYSKPSVSVAMKRLRESGYIEMDVDGYITSLVDEERGQGDDKVVTGRKVMSLLCMDSFRNVLQLKKIFIPAEFVDQLEDNGYEKGRTVRTKLAYQPNTKSGAPKKRGFGNQPVVGGATYLELVLTGGDAAFDEDSKDSISSATARTMMTERTNRLKEIEAKGYQGGSSVPSAGVKGTGSFKPVEPLTDDDIPF